MAVMRGFGLVLAFGGILLIGPSRLSAQYDPKHPTVVKMVDRAVNFLKNEKATRLAGDYAVGGPILVGYALYKTTGDAESPKVKSAIVDAQRVCKSLNSGRRHEGESKIMYEASIAAVLLASVDPGKYQPEIMEVMYFFQNMQKSHGGFGYPGNATGDTSQVQYVMLALWTMREVGIDIPVEMVENTVRYLKSTMDPTGSWGYQGVLGNGRLVKQERVSKSLGTAGIGALIIGGDILGFYGIRKQRNSEDEGIPDAFVRVDLRRKARMERRETTMTRADTDGNIAAAMRYQNASRFNDSYWFYYWLYSQERYESFVEIIENKQNKSPAWYNQGVQALASYQEDDGSWGVKKKKDLTPANVSTALAVLFLIRSTQKAIGQLDAGVTFGGYELPMDVANIKMVGDKIVSAEETSVQNLLAMLEDDEAGDVQVSLLPPNMKLSADPKQRKEQAARLSRLLDSQDYNARRLAARLLGQTEDISVVPDLIYALTDKDPLVALNAEESLRLLSRKLNAGKLTRTSDDNDRKDAEAYWKKWFLGLRPDYVFIDR